MNLREYLSISQGNLLLSFTIFFIGFLLAITLIAYQAGKITATDASLYIRVAGVLATILLVFGYLMELKSGYEEREYQRERSINLTVLESVIRPAIDTVENNLDALRDNLINLYIPEVDGGGASNGNQVQRVNTILSQKYTESHEVRLLKDEYPELYDMLCTHDELLEDFEKAAFDLFSAIRGDERLKGELDGGLVAEGSNWKRLTEYLISNHNPSRSLSTPSIWERNADAAIGIVSSHYGEEFHDVHRALDEYIEHTEELLDEVDRVRGTIRERFGV